MKLTKYQHACFTLEDQGKYIVIDPGIFSNSLPEIRDTVAVILTHSHPDHVDVAKIKQLQAQNAEIIVYGTADTQEAYADLNISVVGAGDVVTAEPFTLQFFGGQHAEIHNSRAVHQNVGVFINNQVFYPGDSFIKPDDAVTVLLLPIAAPWMKVGEAMDYLETVKPQQVIPTHDAVLSKEGQDIHDMWLKQSAERANTKYHRLQPGESVDV